MSEHQRSFIPFGNCVPPDDLESVAPGNVAYATFQAIDNGDGTPPLLEAARKACLNDCDQLAYCEEQRDEIGNELWRTGAKSTVVGAEEVAFNEPAAEVDPLDIPTFRFNLSELPQEPARALDLLRQGVRARQLSLTARPPKNVAIIAREYRELLALNHPDTLEAINIGLDDKERERAYRYIILAMCQQADFKNFSRGVRSFNPGAENRRYRPETHDFGRNYPIVQMYMHEVAAIKTMGYIRPARAAMYRSAAYSQALRERFDEAIKPAQFYSLVDGNPRDPLGALTAFYTKLHSHRVSSPDTAQSVLERRALTNRPHATSAITERQREKLQTAHSGLSASTIKRAMTFNENPAQSLNTIEARISEAERQYGTDHPIATPDVIKKYAKQRNCLKDLGDYITRVEALEGEFAQDPDFTDNQTLRWFAQMHPTDSRQAVKDYQKRLEQWRGWAQEASGRTVPDSYLMLRAKQGDLDSYDEVLKAYIVNNLRQRFAARGRYRNSEAVVSAWMLNRIAALYQSDELERVAENVSALLEGGILTVGVAELSDFQDPLLQRNVNRITDPRSRRYLTFSAGLQALTPTQRLALAYDHNLTRLLYGAQITAVQIGGLTREDMPEGYGKDYVLPLCADLVGPGKNDPLPFIVVSQDTTSLRYSLVTDKPKKEAVQEEPSEVITIVGAGVVHLAETGLGTAGFEKLLPPNQNRWLQHRINALYPPSERRQRIQDIENALRSGRLHIQGDKLPAYRLALDDVFYKTSLDDIDRAVAAHVMRVDRLMYGKDLEHMLKNRLETDDLAAHLCAEILPRTGAWMDLETAAREASVTIETIKDIAEYAHVSRQWRVRGSLLAVSSDIGQHITDPRQATIDDIIRLADPAVPSGALTVLAEQFLAFELPEVRQTYAKLKKLSETRRVTLRDIRRWAPEPLPAPDVSPSPAVTTGQHIEAERIDPNEILPTFERERNTFVRVARRTLARAGLTSASAEDAVNNAALAMYERHVVRGVPLENISSLRAILGSVVRNYTINIIRKELGKNQNKRTVPIVDDASENHQYVYVSEAKVSEKLNLGRPEQTVEETAIHNIEANEDYTEHLLTVLARLLLAMNENYRETIFTRYAANVDADATAAKSTATAKERGSERLRLYRARRKALNYIAATLVSPQVASDSDDDAADEITGAKAITVIERYIAAQLDANPGPPLHRGKRMPGDERIEEMKARILGFLYPSAEGNDA